jgi:SAM-dependent methyltransferase
LLGTAALAIRAFFQRLPYRYAEWNFDRKWGVDTGGRMVPSGDISVLQFAAEYQATPPELFDSMLQCLSIDASRFCFFDLGCGKGRVLLLAAMRPFRAVVGVEFSSNLAKIAERNLRHNRFNHLCANKSVVCADAGEYAFPDENAIIFLFNPFKSQVMEKVLGNVCTLSKTNECYILYHNPILAPSHLDNSPHFSLVQSGPKFKIYKVNRI